MLYSVLKAWKKLLKCLGSCFYPYVNDIIPDLLRSARLDANRYAQTPKVSFHIFS